MGKLWLYGVLARVPGIGYRAKVVALAAIAAALPFALWLAGATPGAWLAAALAEIVLPRLLSTRCCSPSLWAPALCAPASRDSIRWLCQPTSGTKRGV